DRQIRENQRRTKSPGEAGISSEPHRAATLGEVPVPSRRTGRDVRFGATINSAPPQSDGAQERIGIQQPSPKQNQRLSYLPLCRFVPLQRTTVDKIFFEF